MTTAGATQPLVLRAFGRTAAVSPLRYPGGKAALAGFFGSVIRQLEVEPTTYVEPYAGGAGAGVALLRQDMVQHLVINDIDPAVHCFWASVTRHAEKFATLIADTPLDVDEWRKQKVIYRACDESDQLTLG